MLFEYLKDHFGDTDIVFFVNEYLWENGYECYEPIDNLDEFYGERASDLVIALGKGGELTKDFFTHDGYGWVEFLYDYEVVEELEQYESELLEAIEDGNRYVIDGLCYLDITIEELKEGLKEYDN